MAKRKKENEEFIDELRDVQDEYYSLLENIQNLTLKQKESRIRKLILKDPYFFDPYNILADIYIKNNNSKLAEIILDQAFGKIRELIYNKNQKWPDLLRWGWLENRHILRLLFRKAYSLWEKEERVLALDLLRNILRMNPNDNQGVRVFILALRMNFSYDQFGEKFNYGNNMKVHEWFKENYMQFPEEFKIIQNFFYE